jgi:gliding motility-associated-like protein
MRPGDTICLGQSYQLQASGAERYNWTPARWLNNNTIANPITKPDSTITYTVTGSDTLGCFTNSNSVTVFVYPIPKVDILENQVTIGVGDPVQLHSTSSSDVLRWRWSPNIGLTCPDCANTIAQPRETTNYTLTVTNAGGCTAQDRVTITVLCKNSNIFIPNTFSPNGDGANDKFYPRGKGVFSVKSMRIFDRWGELLFEKTNFAANDPSAAWDGTHKGVALSPDVYVYLMEVICDNNVLYNIKGNVTLLK